MTRTLSIDGAGFVLDGEPFDMWGIRLANALENDRVADSLIRVLDDYVIYGVNTFSVFLQGGSTGAANPFDADGAFSRHTRRRECSDFFKGSGDVDAVCERNQVMDRLARLILEADAVGDALPTGCGGGHRLGLGGAAGSGAGLSLQFGAQDFEAKWRADA